VQTADPAILDDDGDGIPNYLDTESFKDIDVSYPVVREKFNALLLVSMLSTLLCYYLSYRLLDVYIIHT